MGSRRATSGEEKVVDRKLPLLALPSMEEVWPWIWRRPPYAAMDRLAGAKAFLRDPVLAPAVAALLLFGVRWPGAVAKVS